MMRIELINVLLVDFFCLKLTEDALVILCAFTKDLLVLGDLILKH